MSDSDKKSVTLSQSYDELNPRHQKVIDNFFDRNDELNKLNKIIIDIKENKHLFDKYDFEISLSFRGQKRI